jgi:methyl-accepting chemotaxis protein
MQLDEQIRSAIAAHGMWKSRLRTAIDTGKADVTVEQARSDHQCAFGKWIYAVDMQLQSSAEYRRCRELHQRFHAEAAGVLQLALAGKKQDAVAAMAPGSRF